MDASKSWSAFIATPDEETFSAIYTTHGTMVWRICHRILGPGEEVDDAFQGTWIRLLLASRDQQTELSRTTADLALTRLAALEANRVRQKRNRLHQREVPMDPLPEQMAESRDGKNAASREELAGMVKAAMALQPEIYRSALELHYLDGLTHQQVAIVLQLPLGTVATRLRTGRTRLIAALKRAGIANGGAALVTAGAMVVPITLPAASTVYASASAASAALPPAVVDFSLLNGKATFALLSTKSALIATLCLIPLAIVMAIYFQPPSRLDAYREATPAEVEKVAPGEPDQDVTEATPPAEEPQVTPTAIPAAAAAETAGLFTVEGVVYTDGTVPVSNAIVTISTPIIGQEEAPFSLQEIARTVSNDEGVYTLPVEEKIFFIIRAKAEGLTSDTHVLQDDDVIDAGVLRKKGRTETLNFRLTAGTDTIVTVQNEAGEPVANATLMLFETLPETTIYFPGTWTTDRNGIALMDQLPSERHDLWVTAAGYTTQHIPLIPGTPDVALKLVPGKSKLGGIVREASTGKPVAGATVRAAVLGTPDGTTHQSMNMIPYRLDVTGTDGSYEFDLSPGIYQVTAKAEGLYLPFNSGALQHGGIPLKNGEEKLDHDLDLVPDTVFIDGIITDAESGEALEGVKVSINPIFSRVFQMGQLHTAASDAEGRYELNVSSGILDASMLLFVKEGWAIEENGTLNVETDHQDSPDVYTLESTMKSIEMGAIRLVQESGEPVVDGVINVIVSRSGRYRSQDQLSAITDEAGFATLKVTDDDASLKFIIYHPEGFSFVRDDITQEMLRKNNPLAIIVPEPQAIEFAVSDEEGNPIPTAQLILHFTSRNIPTKISGSTDREGNFKVAKIVADVYTVTTTAPGYLKREDKFAIADDHDASTPFPIVLEKAKSIKGRVIDPAGRPLSGVNVSVSAPATINPDKRVESHPYQTTNDDGLFHFAEFPYSAGKITFQRDDQKHTELAKFGEEIHDYTFDVNSFVLFVGVVVDEKTGKPLTGYQATQTLMQKPEARGMHPLQSATIRYRSEGTFTFEINANKVENLMVTVFAEGYSTLQSPILNVVPGKEISHIFEMDQGVTVTGRVVTEGGEPVRNTKVIGFPSDQRHHHHMGTIFDGHDQRLKPVSTDADGRFTLENLRHGPTSIIAQSTGKHRQGELAVHISDSESIQDVGDLVVAVGNTLKGIVLRLPDRHPIPNVEVTANVNVDMRSPWVQHSTQTNERGEFTFEGLSNGQVQLRTYIDSESFSSSKPLEEWGFAEFLIGNESLKGQITINGQPEQATVRASKDGSPTVDVITHDGKFLISGLIPGTYSISASPLNQHHWKSSTTVTVPTSEPILIDIVTQKSHGRLLDPDGNPVEGIQVTTLEIRSDDPSYTNSFAWANTKADGTFTLEGVGPGRHKLRAYNNGETVELTEFEMSLGIDKDLGDVSLP